MLVAKILPKSQGSGRCKYIKISEPQKATSKASSI
jgi:hypothetical protein